MIPHMATHRTRRNSSLFVVFSVALSLVVSCGGADKFDLTLQARDDDGSPFINIERQWLADDGRHATSGANSGTFPVNMNFDFGNVECGGQKYVRRYFSVLGSELASGDHAFELTIDDGNRLRLDPQRALDVIDGTTPEASCFEESGRWRGTAGDLQNRTGSFTIHYDSIQTVLRLIED
jgi:hypothetical protein